VKLCRSATLLLARACTTLMLLGKTPCLLDFICATLFVHGWYTQKNIVTNLGLMSRCSTLNDLGFLKKADDGSVVIVVDPTVIKSHTERAKRTKANRSEDLIMDKALLRWTPPSERPMML
jgi:hypothetical protein